MENQADDRDHDPQLSQFIEKLTESQSTLRAYILAALGDYNDAADVLQRTNLTLWRNAESFRAGSEFMPWAATLAKYEVLSFYRDRGRDRHVFNEDVAMLLLQSVSTEVLDVTDRQIALRQCLASLPDHSRELLKQRYAGGASVSEMAAANRKSEDSIKSSLLRVRKKLESCIESRLRSGAV